MMRILLTLCLLFVISISVTHAQTDKPRYLKHAMPLCPIDIMKTYSKEGLIKGNAVNVFVDSVVSFKQVTALVKSGTKESLDSIKIREVKWDTLLIKSFLIEPGYAFNIVQQVGSFSIIKFWPIKSGKGQGLLSFLKSKNLSANALSDTASIPEGLQIKGLTLVKKRTDLKKDSVYFDLSRNYYIVPTQTILNNSTEFENKKGNWNIGLLVLPVKLRAFATESGQFDFSDGFSVGTTFAWTVHHNWKTGFTHNFLLYAGISSYTADSFKLKEKRNDYKIATFSPAIGWMWEKNNVQLSILMGIDFPSGNLQQKWVYRNQPWFGLGLGISLFKINSEASNKTGKNE